MDEVKTVWWSVQVRRGTAWGTVVSGKDETAECLAWIGLCQRQGHEVATSEQIATSANTNPVVIGRLLGELRRAGLVARAGRLHASWSR